MQLSDQQVQRIKTFLDHIHSQVYAELPTGTHSFITQKMVEHFFPRFPLPAGARVLDVGCGQGVALEHLTAMGFAAKGITLSAEDVAACRAK